VRRVRAILLCLTVGLLGAAPVRTPAPSPTPAPPVQTSLPIVVVFPFETSSDIPPADGVQAANLFVDQMNAGGGIDTIAAPATIKTADFLKYALSLKADYYVSGYMTPLGDGVSLVERVVSTRADTIVMGQTAQITSFADASAQAALIHDGIVAQEKGLQDQYQAAEATATATPMASGNEANIGKGLAGIAGLFRRKDKATPAPAAVKPAKGVLIAHVNGSVPADSLNAATTEMYYALNASYNAQMTRASGLNLAQQADGICGQRRDNTIATGTLSAQTQRHALGQSTQWTFVLDVYTCWGAKLAEERGSAGSMNDAVRSAVDAYVKDHPNNA
jgi:hypothetical protein